MDKFIPIIVKVNNKDKTWYLDVSNLSLSELIDLKNELVGTKGRSIQYLDAIIHDEIGYDYNDFKSIKRENKAIRSPMKKSKVYIKRMRKNGR